MSEEPSKEIVVKEPEIIAPASVEKTLDALKRFEDFKRRVLTEDDYVPIAGKKYIKKSGWLKYALACNISLEKREEREEIRDDGTRVYHYTYRAIAPSGRFADAVGSASSEERDFAHEVHDVRALAQTRAMERAISNLVGGGELGAEEMLGAEEKPEVIEVKEEHVKTPVAGEWKVKTTEKPKPEPSPAPATTPMPAPVPATAPTTAPPPKEMPPGARPLESKGKRYGYFIKTEGGGELYFDPPLEIGNKEVENMVRSFLYERVLDNIKKAREERGLFFSYTPIEENKQLHGISFSADAEVMDEPTVREICSAARWTAARAAEKVEQK